MIIFIIVIITNRTQRNVCIWGVNENSPVTTPQPEPRVLPPQTQLLLYSLTVTGITTHPVARVKGCYLKHKLLQSFQSTMGNDDGRMISNYL